MPCSLAPLEVLITELTERIAQPGSLASDDAAFNTLALAVHRHQRMHNEPYRQFCQTIAQGREAAHWREIPALPTAAFRHAALRSFPQEATRATFRTSGTTGEGFGEHHFPTLAVYEAAILAGWAALGLPALPQVILVSPPSAAPHSSLSHMMGTLGRLAPQTWGLTPEGRLDLSVICAAASNGPVLLLGTALAFLHLFETLGEARLPLPPGSFAMETGGYKGSGRSLTKEALYAQFAAKLGLEPQAILNEYSMTELSSQWYTRGLGAAHHGPPWSRALVINPATGEEVPVGERGVVRLFDLANVGSVLAIQTQDLAVRTEDGGFLLLGRDPNALPRGCSRAADEQLAG